MSSKYALEWKDFSSNALDKIDQFRKGNNLCDVAIAVEDYQVDAHKLILATSSPVFRNIFSKMKPQNQLIYLRNVQRFHLDYMLDYVYSGKVAVPQEHLQDFLDLASELKLEGLSDIGQDKSKNKKTSDTKEQYMKLEQNDSSEPVISNLDEFMMVDDTKPPKEELHVKNRSKSNSNGSVPQLPPQLITTDYEIRLYENYVNTKMEKRSNNCWYCLECEKEFMPKNKTCAFRHIDLNHMSSYQFKCNICSRTITAKSNWNYHVRNCKKQAERNVSVVN